MGSNIIWEKFRKEGENILVFNAVSSTNKTPITIQVV